MIGFIIGILIALVGGGVMLLAINSGHGNSRLDNLGFGALIFGALIVAVSIGKEVVDIALGLGCAG